MLEMRCSQGQRPYESSIYAVDVASGLQSAETTAHAEVLQTTQHLCLHVLAVPHTARGLQHSL